MYELVNMYKLVSLIVSHTKVSKLYFYKCIHFLLFLSLSTVLIHQFHPYTKIPTLIPRIATMISHIPILIPRVPTLILNILVIPFILFPDSPFRLLQRAFVDSSIYIQIILIRTLPEMFLQSENNNNNTNNGKHYFESTLSSLQFFFAAAKNQFKPYKAI